MIKRMILLVMIVFCLAACAPRRVPVAPTVTETTTQTPTVTETATPVPPTPTATNTPFPPETFFLDARTKQVKSNLVLERGATYSIQLSGTFSNWASSDWAQNGVCAGTTPEATPMFPSTGTSNGKVGEDPFYWFAFPKGGGSAGPCGKLTPPSPGDYLNFSLDGGATVSTYSPVPAYTTSHIYTITVAGKGYPLIVFFYDSLYADNHGQLKIDIVP